MSRTLTTFRAHEIAVAVAVTCALEGSLAGALWLRGRAPTPARSSPAVLTEVPVLIEPARGFGIGPMPKPAPRAPSPARDVAPSTPARAATPDAPPSDTSPRTTPDAGRAEVTDAALASATSDPANNPANNPASTAASASTDAPSGSAASSASATAATGGGTGGDGDPLAAQQAGVYRGQLDGWFSARFAIRGKIPFDELKTLRAVVVVDVTAERHVSGFRITKPSGNAVFDAELTRALSQIQSSGAELPAPPEERKELLGSHVTLSFSCTSRARCE